MKLSVAVLLTDLLPHRRKLIHKIVKNKIFDGLPSKTVISKLKKAGVTGVEVLLPSSSVRHETLIEVKEVLSKNKMEIYSLHQALRFITKTKIEEINDLFEHAKLLGTKVIVLHMNTAGKQILNPKYISEIKKLQKKYNVKVGFENREKHIGSRHRSYGWDEIHFGKLMQKEDLFITLDVCHLGHSKGDIIDFFNKNKNRVINIHLSDYKNHFLNSSLRPIRFKHLPLGEGELPIKEFLRTLKKEKYNGLLTLEIKTDLKGILESAAIVRNAS